MKRMQWMQLRRLLGGRQCGMVLLLLLMLLMVVIRGIFVRILNEQNSLNRQHHAKQRDKEKHRKKKNKKK
jgi:Tfp pilus assembly protein PilO